MARTRSSKKYEMLHAWKLELIYKCCNMSSSSKCVFFLWLGSCWSRWFRNIIKHIWKFPCPRCLKNIYWREWLWKQKLRMERFGWIGEWRQLTITWLISWNFTVIGMKLLKSLKSYVILLFISFWQKKHFLHLHIETCLMILFNKKTSTFHVIRWFEWFHPDGQISWNRSGDGHSPSLCMSCFRWTVRCALVCRLLYAMCLHRVYPSLLVPVYVAQTSCCQVWHLVLSQYVDITSLDKVTFIDELLQSRLIGF